MSEELFQANSHGIFPYPDESRDSFLHRIMQRKKLEQDREAILQRAYGDKPYTILQDSEWESTTQIMQHHFDVNFIWPLSTFSKVGLRFYELGATFSFEGNCILQMKKKKLFSSLHEEVLLHEAIHIARQDLKSQKYEEIFAYSLSKSFFRKFFGPLFRKPQECLFFVFGAIVAPWLYYYFDAPILLMLTYLLPLAFLQARLTFTKKKLSNCERKLKLLYGKDARKVSFRLLDEEIDYFSKSSLEVITTYIHKNTSSRWKQIRCCYND